MCRWYLHHRHFVLFWFLIHLASFQLVLRWRVLGSALSTRWNKKLKRKLVFRGIWRIKTFNLFRMPPCWDVGTRWYQHRLYTSETRADLDSGPYSFAHYSFFPQFLSDTEIHLKYTVHGFSSAVPFHVPNTGRPSSGQWFRKFCALQFFSSNFELILISTKKFT